MRYRELVTIQSAEQQRSETGAVSRTWADTATDVPATIVPAVIGTENAEMAVIADRYDVVLAGRRDVRPDMAVVDSNGRRFKIDSVDYLLGGRQTHATARLVASPILVEGS